MSKIKIEQDKEFLNDLRTHRKMIMTTEDKELADRQQRSQQRQQKEEERKRKALQSLQPSTSVTMDLSQPEDCESSGLDDQSESDDEYASPNEVSKSNGMQDQAKRVKKISREQLFNADVPGPQQNMKLCDSIFQLLPLLVMIQMHLLSRAAQFNARGQVQGMHFHGNKG